MNELGWIALRVNLGVKARRGFSWHMAWFGLVLASCNFDSSPIVDPRDDPGDGGVSGDGGGGGRGGRGGAGGRDGGGSGGASGAGTGGAAGGGGRSGTGGGGSGTCVPGSFIECQSSEAIRCAANGRDRETQSCGAPGCNAEEKRCNVCLPGERFCDDADTLSTCGDDGLVEGSTDCDEGCNRSLTPAVCNQCSPNASFCLDDNTVRSCDAQGNRRDDVACDYGCASTGTDSAACNLCVPGSVLGCADANNQLVCNADGSGTELMECLNGCSGDGQCNVCVPSATSCAGLDTLRACNAGGTVSTDTDCEFGCRAQSGGALCNRDCRPGTSECRMGGARMATCGANGTYNPSEMCMYGCSNGACEAPLLVPSNLDANTCSISTTTDLEVAASGTRTINTDGSECTSVKTQMGAPSICVMVRRNVTFGAGSIVTVTGSRALALVATGSMTLNGVIDGSANGPVGGPGSMTMGPGVGGTATAMTIDGENTPASAGGGGGGHRQVGASGGSSTCAVACTTPGAGGGVLSSEEVKPLRSGARGGWNSAIDGTPRRGAPGGGGGALQFVSCNAMAIGAGAVIDVGGGGGQGGRPGTANSIPGGGAGGGSGGAILIEAQTTTITSGARFFANGGGGGGGASMNTGMAAPGEAGADGEDAPRARLCAVGGEPGLGPVSTSKAGGNGGCVISSGGPSEATPGEPGVADLFSAAGGGGGGIGRIRINNTTGAVSGGIGLSSPVPIEGVVNLQ